MPKIKSKKLMHLSAPSNEEKAFIHQQVLELSPLLSEKMSISVLLEKSKAKPKYSVTFILAPKSLNIKVRSESNNFFDACIIAKNQAKKTIRYLINHEVSSPIRSIQVEHFKKFPYIQ